MSFQFDSNLNVPIANNDAINNITNTYQQDKSVARLYVIAPRHVVNTYKRPHTYNLDHNFISQTAERIYHTIHGNGSGDVYRESYMNGIRSADTAVIPSNRGYQIDNTKFQYDWTWILQLDNVALDNNNNNIYTGPKLRNRRIYCGYFADEPVVQNMGRMVENNNAVMQTLHSTAFNVTNTATGTGMTQKMVMKHDLDYLPAATCMMMNNNLTEMLRPQDLAESTVPTTSGEVFASNHNSLELNTNKIIPINTALNSPKQHLHDLVQSAMRGVEDGTVNNSTSSILAPTTNGMGSGMFSGGIGTIQANIHNNLKSAVAIDGIGIDGTMTYTLGTIRAMFPNMEVIVSESPMGSTSDLANQSSITRANSGSDIVSTSVPVLATNCGLAEIAFKYASYVPNNQFNIGAVGNQDSIMFDNYASWSEEPSNVSKLRLQSFVSHFREQLVPVLYALGGDFQLMCSYTSSGLCDTLLIYMDDPNGTAGIYQSPLFLGGLNTPLVGSNGDKIRNGEQLLSFKAGIESCMYEILGQQHYDNFGPAIRTNPWESGSTSEVANDLFGNMRF